MNKNNLQKLLFNYAPIDHQELNYKKEMLSFLYQHDTCFERSLEIGHFTASCWLLNKAGDKALLMHHAKLNRWQQLGGHADGNPDLLAVAIKEAQEESGITHIAPISNTIFDIHIFDIDVHAIPENKKEKEHTHYDVRFLLQVMSDEAIVQNEESYELRWISKDAAQLPPVGHSVMRMFNKWIKNSHN